MAAPRLRWSKFWWSDWQTDPSLKMCSYAARGLWMDMLAIMHSATPIGHLLVNGKMLNNRQIAALTGGTEQEVSSLINELEEACVFSRTEAGVIFSRRMIRDHEARDVGHRNGITGGRPKSSKNGNTSRTNTPNQVGYGEGLGGGKVEGFTEAKGEGLGGGVKIEAEAEAEEENKSMSDRGSDVSAEKAPPELELVGGQLEPKPPRSRRPSDTEPEGFAEFYAAYPRKDARTRAVTAFPAAVRAAGGLIQLMDGLRRFRFSPDPQYVPMAASWLNGRRWQDQGTPDNPVQSTPTRPYDPRYFDAEPSEVRKLPRPREGSAEFDAWDRAIDGFVTSPPGVRRSDVRTPL